MLEGKGGRMGIEGTVEVREPWQLVLQYLAIRTGDPREPGQIEVRVERIFWDLCSIEDPQRRRFAVVGGPQKLMSEIERLEIMGCVETSKTEWGEIWGEIVTVTITPEGRDYAKQFAVSKEFQDGAWMLGGNFTYERIFGWLVM